MIEMTVDIAELKKMKVMISRTLHFRQVLANCLCISYDTLYIVSMTKQQAGMQFIFLSRYFIMFALFLQVADLRGKLGELGLETKGTKAELIARVEKYLSEQGEQLLMYDNV